MKPYYHEGQKIEYRDRRFYVDEKRSTTPAVAKMVGLPGTTLACRMLKGMDLSKALTMAYQTKSMIAEKTRHQWPLQGLNPTSAQWLRTPL